MDLKIIHDNYFGLADAIEKLQKPAVPLEESLQIVQHVHAQLCAIEDAKNVFVLEKFESVFEKNSDFGTLKHICEAASTELLSYLKDYFTYANITSLDVERSFSAYKRIFSSCRTSFAETTAETR